MVIFFSIIFSAVVVTLAQRSEAGMQLMVALGYLFGLGIITHELAHRAFCGLFGVRVRETQYFKVTRKRTAAGESVSIGGYVDCEEIRSVTVALCIGFAPLLINGLLVAMLYYYGPSLEGAWYFPLAVYVGISLGLGTPASKEDAGLWVSALKRNPGRGFFELVGLCLFGGILYYLAFILQIPLWETLCIIVGFFISIIILSHSKTSGASRVSRF